MPILATNITCTGCGACENICPHNAIQITAGEESFLMPKIDSNKCIECKLCEKTCPIVNGRINKIKNKESIDCYAFWSFIDRTSSSSGGAFSAIARTILSQRGVVFGASWMDGFECEHIAVEKEQDLPRLQGSKYTQSRIKNSLKDIKSILKTGRSVLFTGTPCQVGGLKSFLGKEYDNLTCIDIVCHGVPSNEIFKSYIRKLKKEFPKYQYATGFEFRNLKAWGYAPHVTPVKSKHILSGISNAYMYAFDKALIFRHSCYNCQFNGLRRVGDITIADFWGIGQMGIPFKHDVSKGVSLVLVNNERGRYIVSHLDNVFIERREISEALRRNSNLVISSRYNECREEAIRAFLSEEKKLSQICQEFSLINKSLKAIIERFLTRLNLFFPLKSIYNKLHI